MTLAEVPQSAHRWGHPRQLWMLLAVTVGMNFGFYGFRAFLALAYQLAGWIATSTTSSAQAGIGAYAEVYERLFLAGLGVSIVYLIAAPKMQKLMHGVH